MNHDGIEIAPCIFIFENIIDNCEEIISAAIKKSKVDGMYEATISTGSKEMFDTVKEVRDTLIVDITPLYTNDVIWWLLAQKMWQYGDDYARHYDIYFSGMEPPQFLFYPQGKGFYKTHTDNLGSFPRVFSSVLYLNDVECGGETYFDKFDIAVNPVPGRLLMFPSNFAYSHGAKIPESGDKYSIVTWFTP